MRFGALNVGDSIPCQIKQAKQDRQENPYSLGVFCWLILIPLDRRGFIIPIGLDQRKFSVGGWTDHTLAISMKYSSLKL